MFKRKNSLNIYSKLRIYFWPQKGFLRNFSYFWKRLIRIPDTSFSISMGFSIGFFIAFTPFFGLHFIISGIISWLLKVNIFSSIIGNFFASFISYPLMAFGMFFISNKNNSEGWFNYFVYFAKTALPIFSGILIIGFVLSFICYFLVNYVIEVFKNKLIRGK
tara:strand:- start:3502 stop:3987 length:486 start_codon:yes stop_codon:yes gene_type:complete